MVEDNVVELLEIKLPKPFLYYSRTTDVIPPQLKEIKPHLLSTNLGILIEMIYYDKCCNNAKQFLIRHFVRISEEKSNVNLNKASIPPEAQLKEIEVLKATKDNASSVQRPKPNRN